MIRTQISLDAALYQEAKDTARRRGISLAELLRQAVARELLPAASAEKPWMRFAGAFESGDPDASTTIDEVVYGRDKP